jgi:hypothetical protein
MESFVTENSEKSTEIKIRIAAGNRCYFSLTKLLKSRAVARNVKVRMYRTIIRPVVTYGSETWCLTANGRHKSSNMGEESVEENPWTSV